MRNYKEWVQWLETRNPMPQIKPGLEKTQGALQDSRLLSLVHPENVIHVAGTNGKGTTAKTLMELLHGRGESVGLFTSPHLVDTCERIQVNHALITPEEFSALCEKYEGLIEKWNLSHFEALTLFAVDYFFLQKKVKWAIFEIGLGGTWDSTNAIPHQTSLITRIGFDHMHILGTTLPEIAANKFGIVQKKNRVLHLPLPKDLEDQLLKRCQDQESQRISHPLAQFSTERSFPLPRYELHTAWGSSTISLSGARAAENMNLALHAFSQLGFSVTQQDLDVLSKVQWPARLTPFPWTGSAPVFLSGDHNLQGLESLLEILQHSLAENFYFILGLSKNRQHDDFLKKLTGFRNSEIRLTQPQFQGVTPDKGSPYPFYEKVEEALESLKEKATAKDLIVVTGSLYLCGDLMRSASRQR